MSLPGTRANRMLSFLKFLLFFPINNPLLYFYTSPTNLSIWFKSYLYCWWDSPLKNQRKSKHTWAAIPTCQRVGFQGPPTQKYTSPLTDVHFYPLRNPRCQEDSQFPSLVLLHQKLLRWPDEELDWEDWQQKIIKASCWWRWSVRGWRPHSPCSPTPTQSGSQEEERETPSQIHCCFRC